MIAQRLGVEHVLEGSVRRAGDRLRVTAQLIRASDGFHLWSETFDRSTDDVIAIQEEIAVSIARALKTAMDPEALAEMVSSGTRSVEAYEAYLEGRAYQSQALQELNLDPLAKARDAFARAVSIDADFAEAHYLAGGLWATLYQVVSFSSDESVDAEAALAHGLEHFDAAIETTDDPVRALKYRAERALAIGALRENIRALTAYVSSVPNDLAARFNLIRALNEMGDRTAALTHAREAEARLGGEDDELAALIQAYQWARDYENAARLSRVALDRETNNASLLYQVQRSLLWAGDVEAAAHARARLSVRGNAPEWTRWLPDIRQACAEGDRSAAEAIAAQIEADSLVSSTWHAYTLLGRQDDVADLLAKLDRADPPYPLVQFLLYPYFDPAPYPNLQRLIARERVAPPKGEPIPFACPPAGKAKAAGPAEKSVAVLPFIALSSGEDDGYFADGLTEEILNALAALPDLLVTARTSSFFYKGKDVPVDEIAERLGVAHVVEGSVRRAGDKVRVTAQLIRAGDGFHLWSKTYDASMDDVFAVQTDIAEMVATALDILLDERKRALMRAAGVKNPEAYAIYAKGEELFRLAHGVLPQIETLVRANREYDRATAAAPELWAASYNSADLYSHVLLQLAAGASLEDMPEGVGADPAGALQQRLDAAMRHAPTQAARDSIDMTRRVFSDDWTGVADLVRKIYRNPEPCGLDQWAHAVGLAFGAAGQGVQYYTRSAKCNRLDGGEWTMASLAALYAGDPERSLAIIEEGRDVYEVTLREEAARLRALMANGRLAEARAGLSRVSSSDNLRASMEGELAAAMGVRAGALAARDRLLAEAAKDPDVFDAGLRLSAQAGDRETANALAAEIDARPAGPMLLLGTVYFCRCGAPFDLEATPTLAARLEEAGVAWPPASPVDWPLKDW